MRSGRCLTRIQDGVLDGYTLEITGQHDLVAGFAAQMVRANGW